MDGQRDSIYPHSTRLRPLSGLMPCYCLSINYIKKAGQRVPLTSNLLSFYVSFTPPPPPPPSSFSTNCPIYSTSFLPLLLLHCLHFFLLFLFSFKSSQSSSPPPPPLPIEISLAQALPVVGLRHVTVSARIRSGAGWPSRRRWKSATSLTVNGALPGILALHSTKRRASSRKSLASLNYGTVTPPLMLPPPRLRRRQSS